MLQTLLLFHHGKLSRGRWVEKREKMLIKMAENRVSQNIGLPFREEIRHEAQTEQGRMAILGSVTDASAPAPT